MKTSFFYLMLVGCLVGCSIEETQPQVEDSSSEPSPPGDPPGGWEHTKGPIGCAAWATTGKGIPIVCSERPWREEDWSRPAQLDRPQDRFLSPKESMQQKK